MSSLRELLKKELKRQLVRFNLEIEDDDVYDKVKGWQNMLDWDTEIYLNYAIQLTWHNQKYAFDHIIDTHSGKPEDMLLLMRTKPVYIYRLNVTLLNGETKQYEISAFDTLMLRGNDSAIRIIRDDDHYLNLIYFSPQEILLRQISHEPFNDYVKLDTGSGWYDIREMDNTK